MHDDTASFSAWRSLVEKDLRGASFEKALVAESPEGLALAPLYADAPCDPGLPGAAPFTRGPSESPAPVALCVRVEPPASRAPGSLDDDLAGGADALWIDARDPEALRAAREKGLALVVECDGRAAREVLREAGSSLRVLALDPMHAAARATLPLDALGAALRELGALAQEHPGTLLARVSTLAVHEAGGDAADELAYALSTAAAYLRAMTDAGVSVTDAAAALTAQVAVGRDTFGELCKLRALRVCWHKLLAAAGAPDAPLRGLHAVCSSRTLSQRDPWVNMLRVTTEVFSALVGGAELVTPLPFDEALSARSPLGRRLARNTLLVLREESHLGRVIDPAGGAYYVEHRTDALAREAWSRFTALERAGGVQKSLGDKSLRAHLDASWARRETLLARRREAVLGVSEFANVGETLPAAVSPAPSTAEGALPAHRDAEGFEALRAAVESLGARDVLLLTLGPASEHRARLGFAQNFFAVAGVKARSADAVSRADVACLCGDDARYADEAAGAARALREAGCERVVLAGRPGALEAALREAGVRDFIYLGCEVLATLRAIFGVNS
ncbi:MAG: methylmalonyl-CoA mutase family protein [Polyangiales bacterium]